MGSRDRAGTSVADISIEGLPSPCDDFVCTSSPAVEQTIRSLARDLSQRLVFSPSLAGQKVTYSDGARRFRGAGGYRTLTFNKDTLEGPRGTVLSLLMVGNGTDQAEIEYIIVGKVKGLDVTLDCKDTIRLNLVTGKIEDHRSEWTATGPGAVAYKALRLAWSAKMGLQDVSKQADELLTGSRDEGNSSLELDYRGMPSDPTKFFQGQNDDERRFSDAVSYAAVLGVLWLLFRAYQELNNLTQ